MKLIMYKTIIIITLPHPLLNMTILLFIQNITHLYYLYLTIFLNILTTPISHLFQHSAHSNIPSQSTILTLAAPSGPKKRPRCVNHYKYIKDNIEQTKQTRKQDTTLFQFSKRCLSKKDSTTFHMIQTPDNNNTCQTPFR